MDLLLPIVAALVAILIVPGWSFYFDVTPKVAVVVAAAALALVFCRIRWTRWTKILALQAMVLALATLFSTHRWFSLYGSTWRRAGFFAELAVLVLAAIEVPDLRLWLRITVLASIPVALYAILQYFGIDPILDPAGYRFGEGRYMIVRPPGTLGHAAYLATYLLYAIFAAAEMARRENARVWKSAAIAASALAFFGMVSSGTRAALAGFVVAALFLLVRERVSRKTIFAAAGLLAALAAFYVSPPGERLRARAFWSSEDPLGGSRLRLWRDTIRMSFARPAAGFGPETFSMEFPPRESVELARAYPDVYHESAHNIFLDALASKGVLGLLAMIAVAAYGLSIARGFLGAAWIAMLIAQQFTAFTLPTELYFYLTVAMLAPAGATVRGKILYLLAIPFAAFAICLATGDALLAAARRALDSGAADRAAQLVDRASSWNASADFYFSRRFASLPARDPVERLRVWQYGLAAARRAPATADDPQNALLNLAAFQANLNDAAAVEQSLREAVSAAPNWYKSHWLLAQVLAQQGRIAEARTEAGRAADLAGGKHPQVIDTRDRLGR